MEEITTVAIAVTDRRQTRAAGLLAERGAKVITFNSSAELDGITDAEILMLPLPLTRDRVHLSSQDGSCEIPLWELSNLRFSPKLVLCGMPPVGFSVPGARLSDYMEDEVFVSENAYATAEGAICRAMSELDVCISAADCAIVGFGRIGRALAGLLSAFGASVTVYARSASARSDAEAIGVRAAPIGKEGLRFVSRHRLVFTTVPSRIISAQSLSDLAPGAYLLELASAPGSFDPREAADGRLRPILLPSLPGKYAPTDAARYMCDSAERLAVALGFNLYEKEIK